MTQGKVFDLAVSVDTVVFWGGFLRLTWCVKSPPIKQRLSGETKKIAPILPPCLSAGLYKLIISVMFRSWANFHGSPVAVSLPTTLSQVRERTNSKLERTERDRHRANDGETNKTGNRGQRSRVQSQAISVKPSTWNKKLMALAALTYCTFVRNDE